MKTYKIAVGTTSKQKLKYLKKVLKSLKIRSNILPVDVPSGASYQPLSSQETKRGSLKRAKSALAETPKADFSIGIEVGYEKNKDKKREMLCWISVVDKNHIVQQSSHSLILPKFHQNIIKSGRYLGDHVRRYHKDSKDTVKIRIGVIIKDREPFIVSALEPALLRYLNRKDF